MPAKTKAEIAQQLDRSNAELARVSSELEKLKTEVVRVALDAQREEGWCQSGLESALNELGLKAPDRRRIVTIQFTIEYEMDPAQADGDHKDDDLDALQRSIDHAMPDPADFSFNGWNSEEYSRTQLIGAKVLKMEPLEN